MAGVGVSLAEATYATTTATITSGMTARPSEALARVCRAAWRLEQARAGMGVGTGLSLRRGSADLYSGRRVAGQEGLVCHHEHGVKFWK